MFTTWKRRYAHPGIYLYRTRRHMHPGSEWGYAGKSRNLNMRDDCHSGRCTRHQGCAGGKPWADLIIRRRTLELPWWLGFDWITLSLETMLIWATRPRYSVQKNPRRRKAGQVLQAIQRADRDRFPESQHRYQELSGTYRIVKLAMALTCLAVVLGGVAWLR